MGTSKLPKLSAEPRSPCSQPFSKGRQKDPDFGFFWLFWLFRSNLSHLSNWGFYMNPRRQIRLSCPHLTEKKTSPELTRHCGSGSESNPYPRLGFVQGYTWASIATGRAWEHQLWKELGIHRADTGQPPTCPSLSLPSHLHNVMVHLQKENKKLKNEIEEKKLKAGPSRVYTKALCPNKTDPTPRGKMYGTMGWRGITQDVSQRMDITKFIGMPHCSGTSTSWLLLLTLMLSFLVQWVTKT